MTNFLCEMGICRFSIKRTNCRTRSIVVVPMFIYKAILCGLVANFIHLLFGGAPLPQSYRKSYLYGSFQLNADEG